MAVNKIEIMTIDQIREKIAIKLSQHIGWVDTLNDTNPGHYGVEV
jgi:hypothetical protein